MSTLDYDTRRGHCYVRGDNGRTIASLTDMGGACAVMTEGDLTAEEATLLGHALISWSAWRRRVIPAVDHYQATYGGERDSKAREVDGPPRVHSEAVRRSTGHGGGDLGTSSGSGTA